MSEQPSFTLDDLALFAMQLLSKEEEAQARATLEQSPDLRRELAEVQGDLAVYAFAVERHSPPALARERLLAQVSRERKVRPANRTLQTDLLSESGDDRSRSSEYTSSHPLDWHVDHPAELHERPSAAYGAGPGTISFDLRQESRLRSGNSRLTEDDLPQQTAGLGRFVPWLGWAVAASLALAAGNLYHESEVLREAVGRQHTELTRLTTDAAAARQLMETLKDPSATRVTLTRSKEAPVPQGKVTYVADRGSLLFVASNLDPLDPYKVYELWLIPANDQPPIPAGTFHPDAHGNASVVLPQLPTGLVAKSFGVTIEDEGGSPTPTMPILLSGAASGA